MRLRQDDELPILDYRPHSYLNSFEDPLHERREVSAAVGVPQPDI